MRGLYNLLVNKGNKKNVVDFIRKEGELRENKLGFWFVESEILVFFLFWLIDEKEREREDGKRENFKVYKKKVILCDFVLC